MKTPAALATLGARFDRLSMRERVLVCVSVLVAVLMLWTTLCFDPLAAKESALSGEMTSLQESMSAAAATLEADINSNPLRLALEQEKKLKVELDGVNAQLTSKAAGLIPPERMVEVIHDVLTRQRGLVLVSLHNKPVTTLVTRPTTAQTQGPAPAPSGPFVHPVELIVEGDYFSVLAYLHALEALPWRFYWSRLELISTRYPTNRVRLELSTLSMDQHWIGV